MHRLFVALAIPEVVGDALSQLQYGLDGARWRPPENFHLTLQFIGDVDRHGLDDVADALSGIAAPAFQLTLSGVGYFGERKPRSVWTGVEPCAGLTHLQSKVETALRRYGVSLENRKFKPHVTLAYLKGVPLEATMAYCSSHSMFSCGPFPAKAFHLYASHLGGDVSHYELLESYSLSSSM